MEELIKLMDDKLEYISHEIQGKEIRIQVRSERKEAASTMEDPAGPMGPQ